MKLPNLNNLKSCAVLAPGGILLLLVMLVSTLVNVSAAASERKESLLVIMPVNIGYYREANKAFVAALAKEGYDDRRVDTLMQMPSPDPMSWTNAARKLRVADVNVVVTYSAPTALASIKETSDIPLVYVAVYDPAGVGVTGRNVTGISSRVPMASLLSYLKKLTPFTRLAVVYDELDLDSVHQAEELVPLESKFGFRTVKMLVRTASDARNLDFTGKADAVLISVGGIANEEIDAIVKNAHEANIPTVSMLGGSADHGVVLTLSPSAVEQGETAARMTARILKGEKPSAIPAAKPHLIEMVLNLKEAGAIGIKVPIDLISDATKVIK